MKRRTAIALIVLLAPSLLTAGAAERFAISPGAIAEAITRSGIEISMSQLTMLSAPLANVRDPQLHVVSVTPWLTHAGKFRIACSASWQCLPFYVIVRWSSAAEAREATEGWKSPIAATHRRTVHQIAIRAGTHVTLVWEGARLRMMSPVVCLQNGAVGERIRVQTLDYKHIYRAEVIDAKTLRAPL